MPISLGSRNHLGDLVTRKSSPTSRRMTALAPEVERTFKKLTRSLTVELMNHQKIIKSEFCNIASTRADFTAPEPEMYA
jgi:hypothetical protein